LLVLGLSLLTQARLNKSLGARQAELASARNFALSGLEDFRQKRARDFKFPPDLGEEQPAGYSESISTSSGQLLGRYQVEYSLRRLESHGVIMVKSTGMVGQSQVALTAYLEDSDGLQWLGITAESPDFYP
jgi:hypothetical protein